MSNAAIAVPSRARTQLEKLLAYGMATVVCLHAILLLALRPSPVAPSRFLTAAVPILAGATCIWRARRLPSRERPVWLWASAGMLLWAIAPIVETVVSHSTAPSGLPVHPSALLYLPRPLPAPV